MGGVRHVSRVTVSGRYSSNNQYWAWIAASNVKTTIPSATRRSLGQAGGGVGPVVDRQDGHGGIEGTIGERQSTGNSANCRCRTRRTLGQHDRRRFHGYHSSVVGFVGARPGPYVQDKLGVPKSGLNLAGDPGIGLTVPDITSANGVIGRLRGHPHLLRRSLSVSSISGNGQLWRHRIGIDNRDKSSYRIASWLTALARCKMTRYLEESQP